MELLEGLDWGTYYFFRFQANAAPRFAQLMQIGSWCDSYLACALMLALALAVTPPAARRRMALVVGLTFLFGGILIESVKLAAQRPRPPDAQNFLDNAAMSTGFPSR